MDKKSPQNFSLRHTFSTTIATRNTQKKCVYILFAFDANFLWFRIIFCTFYFILYLVLLWLPLLLSKILSGSNKPLPRKLQSNTKFIVTSMQKKSSSSFVASIMVFLFLMVWLPLIFHFSWNYKIITLKNYRRNIS